MIVNWECQKEVGVYSRMKKTKTTSSPSLPDLGFLTGVISSCPSSDTSIFCQFSRFVQVIGMIIFLAVVVYFIYVFASAYFFKKSRR